MPVRSPPEDYDLAVVALSARALARSASRAGLNALALDLFADADTREHATRAVRAPAGRRGLGFDCAGLLATVVREAPQGLPVVLGAGFEHAPGLMRAIARRNPILGARPETVALLKSPKAFATLLATLGVPHPDVLTYDGGGLVHLSPAGRGRRAAPGEGVSRFPDFVKPPHPLGFASRPLPAGERCPEAASLLGDGRSWLSKRAGASGGGHIRATSTGRRRCYLQRRVRGRTVSALFLADGRTARVVGFSEQWTDPTLRAPFRYGGAVGPVAVDGRIAEGVAGALDAIVNATGLVGIASTDMILPDDGSGSFVLLEINPRPGATLDVFDRCETPSLLKLHLDACAGRLPAALPAPRGAQAAAIVYAPRAVAIGSRQRPVWTADWPSCDVAVPAGAPVCTIVASGASPHAARALVENRRAALLASLRAAPLRAPTNTTVTA